LEQKPAAVFEIQPDGSSEPRITGKTSEAEMESISLERSDLLMVQPLSHTQTLKLLPIGNSKMVRSSIIVNLLITYFNFSIAKAGDWR
jgi:hypothetical protein